MGLSFFFFCLLSSPMSSPFSGERLEDQALTLFFPFSFIFISEGTRRGTDKEIKMLVPVCWKGKKKYKKVLVPERSWRMWSHQTQLVGIYIYICGGPCVLLMAHGSTKLVRAHTHTTLAGRKIERERELGPLFRVSNSLPGQAAQPAKEERAGPWGTDRG